MTKARTLADFNTTAIPASVLTGALPSLDGSSLTNLPSGGKVVQTKHYSFTSTTTMTSNGQVHANCNITPTSASNKILVIISSMIESSGGLNDYASVDLRRGTTYLSQFINALGYQLNAGVRNTYTINWLDDPQTTNQIEYNLNHLNGLGSADYYYKVTNYTLLEIET